MHKPFAQNIIQISFPPNCNNLQILIQFANQTDTGKVKPIKIDAVLVWLWSSKCSDLRVAYLPPISSFFPQFYPAAKTILTSARWALKIKNYTHKI